MNANYVIFDNRLAPPLVSRAAELISIRISKRKNPNNTASNNTNYISSITTYSAIMLPKICNHFIITLVPGGSVSFATYLLDSSYCDSENIHQV